MGIEQRHMGDQLIGQRHVFLNDTSRGQDKVCAGLKSLGPDEQSVLLGPQFQFFWFDWHFS